MATKGKNYPYIFERDLTPGIGSTRRWWLPKKLLLHGGPQFPAGWTNNPQVTDEAVVDYDALTVKWTATQPTITPIMSHFDITIGWDLGTLMPTVLAVFRTDTHNPYAWYVDPNPFLYTPSAWSFRLGAWAEFFNPTIPTATYLVGCGAAGWSYF